jgi:hypothetical protein
LKTSLVKAAELGERTRNLDLAATALTSPI